MTNLKSKATSGMLWSVVDRIGVNIGQLILSIILARLLTPKDFGLIAIIYIFIAISSVLVNSGMGSALVQRQGVTSKDYSTVFVFNLLISILLYVILYLTAPFISEFYDSSELLKLIRIIGLILIIDSFSLVQRAYLQKTLDIRSLAKSNIIAFFTSAIISILLALKGFGVGALASQILLNSIISTICLYYFSPKKISIIFSKSSFKNLFNYSYKLLLSGLYAQALQQVTSMAIGKYYIASQLGYYSQAKKFADTGAGTLSNILNTTSFPILSSLQEEQTRFISVFRRLIKLTAFICLPTLLLIAALAEPIVKVTLGNQWLEAIPILQWLACANAFRPFSVINMNILKAIGRSDLFLKVDLAKFPFIAIILAVTIPMGVDVIAKGMIIMSVLSFIIETYLPGKLFNYGALSQLKDITKSIVATSIMVFSAYLILQFEISPMNQLFIITPVSVSIYITVSYYLKIEELNELITIKNHLLKRYIK